MLNTQISFQPPIIHEFYPLDPPSLYKGQQMILSGRYTEATNLAITLNGTAFGQPISYQYNLILADSAVTSNQFLTKVWAKKKIEYLLVQFYSLNSNSAEAQAIKQQIVSISIAYGVLSPFTAFVDPTGIENELAEETANMPHSFELLGNYPNPFNPETRIRIKINQPVHNIIFIKIYNTLGQLIRVLVLNPVEAGIYELLWNGQLQDGSNAPSGVYVYIVEIGNEILAGKMTLLR